MASVFASLLLLQVSRSSALVFSSHHRPLSRSPSSSSVSILPPPSTRLTRSSIWSSYIRSSSRLHSSTAPIVSSSSPPIDKKHSFIQDDLRPYAMKLHTREQSPREGEQPVTKSDKPFTQWQASRSGYLQFLVDSLAVYEAIENVVASKPDLADLRSNGLERTASLRESIRAMTQMDATLDTPVCGPHGLEYAALLRELADESLPKFVCHFYNQYFAHTAGGRMIGKKMSDSLLGGLTLPFYEWPGGDVKEMMEAVRMTLDRMAEGWTEEEKELCRVETMACFRYGGALMSYIKSG